LCLYACPLACAEAYANGPNAPILQTLSASTAETGAHTRPVDALSVYNRDRRVRHLL